MFTNYVQVRDWLESFIPLVYGKEELGLARIENLLEKLDNPQQKFKSIHVGGTSGKGTTAFYISRLLAVSGQRPETRKTKTGNWQLATGNFKIGLHVSPHLNYIGERMQINGKNISVKRLVSLVNDIKPVVDEIKSKQPHLTPSYFEILVATAFLYFAEEKVDFAVVEVGLGGRLDATNVLSPEVSVITNIGLDHTEILGDSLEKIAGEKAGIIKTHVPVVTAALGNSLKVIEKVAKSKGARLINIYTQGIENLQKPDVLRYITNPNDIESYTPYYVNRECALLAVSAVLELKMPLPVSMIKKAFSVQFAGRFEEIEPSVILDGAHNADKILSLINFIRNSKLPFDSKLAQGEQTQNSKIILVVAFKTGKDWKKMLDILVEKLPIKSVIATEYQSVTDTGLGSAVPAEGIADYIETRDQRPEIMIIKNSQEAVFEAILSVGELESKRVKNFVLVTGSLYLVGEARTLWKLPEF